MEKGKKLLGILLAFVLIFSAVPALSLETSAAPIVFTLNPSRTTDNLEMIPAGAAERSSSVGIFNAGSPKYFWLTNFGANSADYVEWTISSPAANEYSGWIHIETGSPSQYNIEVIQGGSSTNSTFATLGRGWEKAELDSIQIPAGESKLRLTRTTGTGTAKIKGLDIIKKSDLVDYINRVNAFKSDTTDFSSSGYGLFFQYGVWGYPEFGGKKTAEQATNDFDVDSFVDMVEATGSGYIIWSLTWWQYRTQMPITAIDDILGHSNFTTERNLVGEIAAACKERGIDFFLYYHQGIQQEPTWKAKQNWPEGFTLTGTGDRETFFDNWESVISEIGQTLGTDLAGWYFDDGCTYWPAPFERLGAAAKAGNPDRLLSYNDWVGTSVTDFQENTFGEGGWGGASASSPTDPNGILTGGRDKGLLYAAMPMLERENWGIEHANQSITLQYTSGDVIGKVKDAMARRVPVSLNLQMWEDGRIGTDTLNLLLDLKKGIRDNIVSEEFINDDNTGITYSSGWVHDTRYSENHHGDIHVNTDPDSNPTVTLDFRGDGIDIVSNMGDWGQKFKVSLKTQSGTDFEEIGEGTLYDSVQKNKLVVFSKKDLTPNDYTIKIEFSKDPSVTRPENHAQLDGFTIYNSSQTPSPDVGVSRVNVASPLGSTVGTDDTVQMTASVLPQHATNKTVSWQVTDLNGENTPLASIDSDTGSLTTLSKTGFIRVTATSNHGVGGSVVNGSSDIEIIKLPKTVTIKGNESVIDREGLWTIRSGSCDSTQVGATLSYDFEGEQIEWYGVVANDHGIAEVFIDGEFKQTVDCYATDRGTDILLYKSEKLSDEPHNITIKLQGKNQDSSDYYIELYRLIITLKEEEPEVPPDPAQTLDEAKQLAEANLTALSVSNATTESDIMSAVESAIANENISASWSVPFSKTLATTTAVGRIAGEIVLSETPARFAGEAVIMVDKEIAKLPLIPEPEEPKTIEEAKQATEKALADYTFTNETTEEELLQLISDMISDPDCVVTIPAGGFVITPATSDTPGSAVIKVTITKGGESVTMDFVLSIAVTEEPKTIEEAKQAAEKALTDYTFTNETTEEELLQLISDMINDPDCVVTIPAGGFVIAPATSDTPGSAIIKVTITKGGESVTMDFVLSIVVTEEPTPPIPPTPPITPETGESFSSSPGGSSRKSVGSSVPDKSPNLASSAPKQEYTVSQFKSALQTSISNLASGEKQVVINLNYYTVISDVVMAEAVNSGKTSGIDVVFHLNQIANNIVTKRLTIKADASLLGKGIGFDNSLDNKIQTLLKETISGEMLIASVTDSSLLVAEIAIKLPPSLESKDLLIYLYDSTTKTYSATNIKYWIDANQYIRFNIVSGGHYVVAGANVK